VHADAVQRQFSRSDALRIAQSIAAAQPPQRSAEETPLHVAADANCVALRCAANARTRISRAALRSTKLPKKHAHLTTGEAADAATRGTTALCTAEMRGPTGAKVTNIELQRADLPTRKGFSLASTY